MRTDDPRLEASRKAMLERVAKFNALMLMAIKGHLIVEQAIDEFLEASMADPAYISGAHFRFADKIRLCRAMSFDQSEDRLWTVIGCVNGLRNSIAHGHEEKKIAEAMRTVKTEYLASLTPEQAEGIKGLPDDQMAEGACVTCAGFLVTITSDAKSRRAVIDKNWKPGQQ
jgi:hypothetical protein